MGLRMTAERSGEEVGKWSGLWIQKLESVCCLGGELYTMRKFALSSLGSSLFMNSAPGPMAANLSALARQSLDPTCEKAYQLRAAVVLCVDTMASYLFDEAQRLLGCVGAFDSGAAC